MISFKERVVLITGAARGLGYAYARKLGSLGATVLIQDVGADKNGWGVDDTVAQQAAENLRNQGIAAAPFPHKIDSRHNCHTLINACMDRFGRIDGVIHNAGWVACQRIEEVDEVTLEHMINIGAKAGLWLTQAAWPFMAKARYGRVVLTTSDRALYPQYAQDGLIAYAATKMAVVGMVNVLASEGRTAGIMVNAISPVAKTRIWGVDGEPDELHPADVATGAAYLVSDACSQSGWILRASNGQFHASRATEALSVTYPRDLKAFTASSVDEIAANWDKIAQETVEPRS